MSLNIVVCVKVVPKPEEVKINPETNGLDRRGVESIINPPDKNAIEAAITLRELYGGTITLLTMAPPFVDDFLRLMMAMGCDDAVIVSDRKFALADSFPTVHTLAAGIKKIAEEKGSVDLVLTGVESADGGTGNVPPGLAATLNYSQATYAEEIDYNAEEHRFIVNRLNGSGHEIISIPKPAVVSIELGINSPRFPNFKKKLELDENYKVKIWDNTVLNLPENRIGLSGSFTTVKEMEDVKLRERKHIQVSGKPEEIAEELANIILSNL